MLDLTDFQNKKYVTTSGEQRRIICIDAPGLFPLVSIETQSDCVRPCTHTYDGKINTVGASKSDIFNAKIKREGWVNVYPVNLAYGCSGVFDTEQIANRNAHDYRSPVIVACIRIEWEE